MAIKVRKTEHAGPKNRGGHWGRRSEAKAGAKKKRRSISMRLARACKQTSDKLKNESN